MCDKQAFRYTDKDTVKLSEEEQMEKPRESVYMEFIRNYIR